MTAFHTWLLIPERGGTLVVTEETRTGASADLLSGKMTKDTEKYHQHWLEGLVKARATTPSRPSIVNGQIAAAVAGEFGNVQFTQRTSGSELFVNPLMTLYFAFDLPAVARRSMLLPLLGETATMFEVSAHIEAFRYGVTYRPRCAIPH